MNIIEYSKALYKTARYQIIDGITEDNKLATVDHAEIVNKINDDGIIVIDNFYSAEKCDALIKEIDRLLIDQKDKVQGDVFGADNRIFGADRASDLIHDFFTNEFISAIKDAYHKKKNIIGFTLAARINAAKNNLGSGGGWHRDRIYGKQFKAIIYLTDTSEENGPFQYIPETHKPLSKVKTVAKHKIKAFQDRISQEEIDFIIAHSEYEISTLTGKKGTLILTDTTGIHRGKPLEKDCRYALTNYYFEGKVPEHIGKLLLEK